MTNNPTLHWIPMVRRLAGLGIRVWTSLVRKFQSRKAVGSDTDVVAIRVRPKYGTGISIHLEPPFLEGIRENLRLIVELGVSGGESTFVLDVDGASTDDTGEIVEVLSAGRDSPSLRCLSLSRVSVNGARNAGIKGALGQVECIVDDDELVHPTYLKAVVERMQQDTDLDGVGGPYRHFGRSRIRTCGRCVPGVDGLAGSGNCKVSRLFGGNTPIRKQVFERRGLFDEELSGFGDELDWSLCDPPLDLLYDPDLWLWHRRGLQTLFELRRAAWSQGMAIPLRMAKSGTKESSSFRQILRYIGHGIGADAALALSWLVGRQGHSKLVKG